MTVLRTHRFNDIWQEMNRWQQHMGERDYAKNACGVFPPINTYDNGESYIVRAEIPGISLDDLDITATSTQLPSRSCAPRRASTSSSPRTSSATS